MIIIIRIKELRKQKRLSQNELAEIIGVAQNTLSNWENGNRQPDMDSLKKIANYFNVSVDYLLEIDDGTKIGANKKNQNDLCENAKIIARDVESFTPEQLAAVSKIIKEFKHLFNK